MERSACVRVCLNCWPYDTLVDTAVQVPLLCVCVCTCVVFSSLPRLFVLRLLLRCQNWSVSLGEEQRSGSGDRCRPEREGAVVCGGGEKGETSGGCWRRTEGQNFRRFCFFTLAMWLFRGARLMKNSPRQIFCFSYSFIPFYGLSTFNCSVSEEQAKCANQLAVYYWVACPSLSSIFINAGHITKLYPITIIIWSIHPQKKDDNNIR